MIDMLSKIENRGIERGLAQGRELGRIDTARNMLAHGVTPDLVVKYPGITLDRIREMADEHER